MSGRALTHAALDQLLTVCAEMMAEINEIADSLVESSGDESDAAYLRELVSRGENAMKVLSNDH